MAGGSINRYEVVVCPSCQTTYNPEHFGVRRTACPGNLAIGVPCKQGVPAPTNAPKPKVEPEVEPEVEEAPAPKPKPKAKAKTTKTKATE
jgi:hypothetical protein